MPHLNNAANTEDLSQQRRSSEAASSRVRRAEIQEQVDDQPIGHVTTIEQQPTYRPI